MLAGVGTFIYALTGWLTLLGGADFFLNYNYMPIRMEAQNEMHATGIFLIEIGVAICVMMTIINLLDAIVKGVKSMDVLNEFLKTKGLYTLVMILFFLGVYGMVLSKNYMKS